MVDPVSQFLTEISADPDLAYIDLDWLEKLLRSGDETLQLEILEELEGNQGGIETDCSAMTEADEYMLKTGCHLSRPEREYRKLLAKALRAALAEAATVDGTLLYL